MHRGKHYWATLLLLVFIGTISLAYRYTALKDTNWNKETPLAQVLQGLGEPAPLHAMDFSPEQVKMGYELFHQGQTISPEGKTSKRISKYFVCTQCHNTTIEDPDLAQSNPQARLEYAMANDLAFLQGTTMYGTVNRTSWYNGDYYKKYGDLVYKANASLEEAVQLCAKECAQGRYLEPWEVKAILAYYGSIGYKLGDLDLSKGDWEKLLAAQRAGKASPETVQWLRSFFLQASPATFGDAPYNRKEGFSPTGNPENGKHIYQRSCLTCHDPLNGVTHYLLDDQKLTHQHLYAQIPKYTEKSLYHVVKYGTKPVPGYRPYMPHYTLERMSNQQLEDLRAYITVKAGKSPEQ